MTYKVLKNYEPHNFHKGDIVGISARDPKFTKKLLKEGIIEVLTEEETQAAFDELKRKEV